MTEEEFNERVGKIAEGLDGLEADVIIQLLHSIFASEGILDVMISGLAYRKARVDALIKSELSH